MLVFFSHMNAWYPDHALLWSCLTKPHKRQALSTVYCWKVSHACNSDVATCAKYRINSPHVGVYGTFIL